MAKLAVGIGATADLGIRGTNLHFAAVKISLSVLPLAHVDPVLVITAATFLVPKSTKRDPYALGGREAGAIGVPEPFVLARGPRGLVDNIELA